MEERDLQVAAGFCRHWDIYLNPNQYFLGRTVIRLKRPVADIIDASPDEQRALWYLVQVMKKAIEELWQPDAFDTLSRGHSHPHCGLEIIPRYQTARTVCGTVFEDKRYPSGYGRYCYSLHIPPRVVQHIHKLVQTNKWLSRTAVASAV